ncbi:hypothetical protein C8R47DRAFT_1090271 [Mycena vitilis]|nr:hypothetical protein C8R47DRAFT_1090271 [Mycena vitilis]
MLHAERDQCPRSSPSLTSLMPTSLFLPTYFLTLLSIFCNCHLSCLTFFRSYAPSLYSTLFWPIFGLSF